MAKGKKKNNKNSKNSKKNNTTTNAVKNIIKEAEANNTVSSVSSTDFIEEDIEVVSDNKPIKKKDTKENYGEFKVVKEPKKKKEKEEKNDSNGSLDLNKPEFIIMRKKISEMTQEEKDAVINYIISVEKLFIYQEAYCQNIIEVTEALYKDKDKLLDEKSRIKIRKKYIAIRNKWSKGLSILNPYITGLTCSDIYSDEAEYELSDEDKRFVFAAIKLHEQIKN